MIEHLKKLSPETIEAFIETRDREALGIPPKLALYILQLNDAAILNKKHHSISECAKHLQTLYPELSIPTCKSRIYDSINYLNGDCSVTESAWQLYYADMYMKLFEVNLTAHNFREARTCLHHSKQCRLKASGGAVDPERIKFKPQLVSSDITLERMGIEKKGLQESLNEAITIIEGLDINDNERERLKKEVYQEYNITDVEHEEIEN